MSGCTRKVFSCYASSIPIPYKAIALTLIMPKLSILFYHQLRHIQPRMEHRSFVSHSPRLSEVDYLLLRVEQELQAGQADATKIETRADMDLQVPDMAGSRILPCGAVEETSGVSSSTSASPSPSSRAIEIAMASNSLKLYNELLAVLDGYEIPRESSTTYLSSLGGSTSLQFSDITKEDAGAPVSRKAS